MREQQETVWLATNATLFHEECRDDQRQLAEKMSETHNFSDENVTETGLEKLWMLLDSEDTSGTIDRVQGLLRSLPELEESEVRDRISELLPDYEPAGTESSR